MALPNDVSRVAQGLANYSSASDNITDAKAAAKTFIRRLVILAKPAADAMAADATAYTAAYMVRMPVAWRLLGANIMPQSTLTAHAANNASINVVKGDGAAGAAVVMATYTSDVAGGDMVAGTTKGMTAVSVEADKRGAIGTVISFNITKAAAGVVVPILTIEVDVEIEGVDGYGA